VFEIQALAGIPQILTLLDEHCGDQTRAEALQQFREDLADTAVHLRDGWAPKREAAHQSARSNTGVRRNPVLPGDNDLCPCGSGKKHKLCCS